MVNRIKLPINEIVTLYGNGMSENAISKRFNVSRNVIALRLTQAGIKRRTQSEAETLKWSQMSEEMCKHQVKAAHDKVRGMKRSHENLVNHALSVQAKGRMSKFEKLFFEAFTKAEIEVVPQYAVDVFNVDFAIPEKKIAIEVDGGHWHSSPRKIKQDIKKTEVLVSLGWTIIRFEVFRRKIEDVLADAVETVRSYPSFKG